MSCFHYRDGHLHAEDVPLRELAQKIGTPLYVYSGAAITQNIRHFRTAFGEKKIGLFYAVKANGNLAVLKTVARENAGADVVSEGEIRKCLAAGIPAARIIYSGVGKTDGELGFAVDAGLYQINVETEDELSRLSAIAHGKGRKVDIALRINPAIGAGGHAKISTGGMDNKFGISADDAARLYKKACDLPGLNPLGLAVHIGSQVMELEPLREAYLRLRQLAEILRVQHLPLSRLDCGGGLGIVYDTSLPAQKTAGQVEAYARMVLEVMHGFDVELGFEPGRLIAADAGVLLTKVVTLNERPQKKFLIVDAGMNDLLRPALYDARHDIWPLIESNKTDIKINYDVVGPVCESSDSFGDNFYLAQQKPGALLCLMLAGAYGSSMASTYNQRPLVPEVMVHDAKWALVRERQSYETMIGTDKLPPWLAD